MPMVYETYPLDELVRHDPRHQFRNATAVALSNPVSPLFLRSQFRNMDFEILRPILKFATLEVDTSCFMVHLSALCLSRPKQVQYPHGKVTYGALSRMDAPLGDDTLSRIRRCLKALGPHLEFGHGEMDSPSTQGTCTATSKHVPAQDFPLHYAGYGSVIRINTTRYTELLDAVEHYKQHPEESKAQDRLFATYFSLAQLLLHEIAHAIITARFGDRGKKCWPFENRIFSEDGFDFESTLFGGIVLPPHEGTILVTDWPAPAVVERYLRNRQEDVGVTGSIGALTTKKVGNVWKMPPSFVRAPFKIQL